MKYCLYAKSYERGGGAKLRSYISHFNADTIPLSILFTKAAAAGMYDYKCVKQEGEISNSSTRNPCSVFKPAQINITSSSVKKNSVASVRERTIPSERPPLVDEVSANF
jgi:hypothetical protein